MSTPPRRLVIHFNLHRTIVPSDLDGTGQGGEDVLPFSTDLALKSDLVSRCWGTVEPASGDWVLATTEVTDVRPAQDLISYKEYLQQLHPISETQARFTNEENLLLQRNKILNFVEKGSGPGQKLKTSLDQLAKCLIFPKAVGKAYGVEKNIIFADDKEATWNAKVGSSVVGGKPENPELVAQQIARYGRFVIVPGFFALIQTLVKQKREFGIVLHSFSDPLLDMAIEEINAFCDGYHPCFNGQNKTKKPLLNGEKGNPDLRITPLDIGRFNRAKMSLEFEGRPEQGYPWPGEDVPLVFDSVKFSGVAEMYAGLLHNVCLGKPPSDAVPPPPIPTNTEEGDAAVAEEDVEPLPAPKPPTCGMSIIAVREDFESWSRSGFEYKNGKHFLLDSGDSSVQQIWFDGCCSCTEDEEDGEGPVVPLKGVRDLEVNNSLSVIEVVGGQQRGFVELYGAMTMGVSLRQMLLNPQYFVEKVQECERGFEKRIAESRAEKNAPEESSSDQDALLRDMDADTKSYLYKHVIPGLLPALETCCHVRPSDPLEFLAFYLMRHGEGYEKTLHN